MGLPSADDSIDSNDELNKDISEDNVIVNFKIDWTISVLCQNSRDKQLYSTPIGFDALSKQVIKSEPLLKKVILSFWEQP